MKHRGFCVFAEGEEYVKQSYLLALSLRASNNEYPISIVTCDSVPDQYSYIFDEIIPIPWYTPSKTSLKTENRWKIYHATPYEETIVLDSDVLVLQNLDFFWRFLENYAIYFTTNAFTYRKECIDNRDTPYRQAFNANQLPNFYNAVHFFRKSDFAQEFFRWVELISNNWELFYGHFCKEHYPKQPSQDITTAIAAKIMDCDTEISNPRTHMPELVHMKSLAQLWKNPTSRWQDRVGVYLNEDLQLKIGNHRQDTIFHYTENDFCTDDIIGKYEQCLKTQ
jgi:hypothetical protein